MAKDMMRAMLRWLFGWFLALALCGVAFSDTGGSVTPASQTLIPGGHVEYRLGSGDKLRISVFGEDTLSGEFLVPGGAGLIAFPLIGDVQAAGLTVNELQAEIESKLKPDYLKDPHVSIEVLNYRPFYILGEVMKPGEYPYTSGLTVLNAVATANGFTYRANTHKVYIKRANSTKEKQYPLDATTVVQPGDTIRIGERFF
jgi:protein involved in polysaccharide export with SLBB domain